MTTSLLALILVVAVAAYWLGRNRALRLAGGEIASLHSRPVYHGLFVALAATLPALVLIPVWRAVAGAILDSSLRARFADTPAGLNLPQVEAFLRDARAIASGGIVSDRTPAKEAAAEYAAAFGTWSTALLVVAVVALVAIGFRYAYAKLARQTRTRHHVERVVRWLLILASGVAILTTLGIVLSLIFESLRFFAQVPFFDFLLGLNWSPQRAYSGAGAEGATDLDYSSVFGALPLFAGTFLITVIAMLVAAPIGLMSAIYLSDYASPKFRAVAKPVLEILAGVPTVVYGFFAALTVAPALVGWGENVGLDVSSESALAAGLVMGIMIIPFVSSLSDDVINAVPQSLRDGSAGLGATKSETIRKVVLPAALPGIVSALMLAISRAVGETMIVVMAAGLGAANLRDAPLSAFDPLESTTTVTVQIVTLLVGDQEFDSAKTLAAFALGLTLFVVTLSLNVVALRVVQRYREQYD